MNGQKLMRVQTRGARRISGPLLFLERVTDLPYGAMVQVDAPDGSRKTGQVIEVSEELAVVQVFEDTMGLDVSGTSVCLQEREARLGVSEDLVGRIMNGAGQAPGRAAPGPCGRQTAHRRHAHEPRLPRQAP